jgi:transposase-like protein
MGRKKKVVEEPNVHKRESVKERKARFLIFLKEEKGNITNACKRFGMTRAAYYKWYNKDSEFAKEADEITDETLDWVESKLMNLIDRGNYQSIIFYLKTRGKKRGYVEKSELDVGFNEDKNVIIIKPYEKKDE